jgi:RNA polymerase sigma-70 factor (ECF subfamily)
MSQKKAKIYHELLILKAQAGERDAFEKIVKLWEKPFFSYARAYTGSESVAWDVVQETWLVIIRKLNSLSHPAKFKSWAFQILNNKCADYFRKASTDRKLKQSIAEKTNHKNGKSDEKETLQKAMQRLASEQKTLILLRFNQNMSIFEISKTLNIPEGTVKSRLHRTLNELKLLYQGD